VALSAEAEKALNAMDDTFKALGYRSHHQPQDYRKPIRIFVERYQAGDSKSLHPDTVREWAENRGWSKSDARDLGEMADTVRHTLMHLDNPTL
jgi:hypothetical protein